MHLQYGIIAQQNKMNCARIAVTNLWSKPAVPYVCLSCANRSNSSRTHRTVAPMVGRILRCRLIYWHERCFVTVLQKTLAIWYILHTMLVVAMFYDQQKRNQLARCNQMQMLLVHFITHCRSTWQLPIVHAFLIRVESGNKKMNE